MEPAFYRRLLTYSWPYNIRELEQALQRALLVAAGSPILRSVHLRLAAEANPSETAADARPAKSPPTRAGDELALLLDQNEWNICAVARLRDVKPTQIYRWMKKYGLERPK